MRYRTMELRDSVRPMNVNGFCMKIKIDCEGVLHCINSKETLVRMTWYGMSIVYHSAKSIFCSAFQTFKHRIYGCFRLVPCNCFCSAIYSQVNRNKFAQETD